MPVPPPQPVPQPAQQPGPQGGQQSGQNRTPPAGQPPVAPAAPGSGTLSNPLFSGDHVLERIAAGQGLLKAGASGPAVRGLQQFLVAQGLSVGRAGADGIWGSATTSAVKSWQASHGLSNDGVVGKNTLRAMDKAPPAAAPGSPSAATTTTNQPAASTSGPSGGNTAAQGAQRATSGAPGSRNGGLPADFQQMWDAHPHNYQDDASQNTASDDLQVAQGWKPDEYSNTCAIRLSIMFNNLGGNYKITRDKAKAAGIGPGRIPYSKKTGWYYILSAKEMWQYVDAHFGKAHAEFPARGRFLDADGFKASFDKDIAPLVAGRKGIVAFDKIFGYAGTGHVDLFDGLTLSDAATWYSCQAIKLWFV